MRRKSSGSGAAAVLFLVGFACARDMSLISQLVAAAFAITLILLTLPWLRSLRRKRLTRRGLLSLTPTEFEQRVQLLLQDLGWQNVRHRGGRGDRGVDLVAEKNGRWIVQCKRYKENVRPQEVRELVGTLAIQRADHALLVTTGHFTTQGYKEAGQRVELWDGDTLAEKIQQVEKARRSPERKRRARIRFFIKYGIVTLANMVAVLLLGAEMTL